MSMAFNTYVPFQLSALNLPQGLGLDAACQPLISDMRLALSNSFDSAQDRWRSDYTAPIAYRLPLIANQNEALSATTGNIPRGLPRHFVPRNDTPGPQSLRPSSPHQAFGLMGLGISYKFLLADLLYNFPFTLLALSLPTLLLGPSIGSYLSSLKQVFRYSSSVKDFLKSIDPPWQHPLLRPTENWFYVAAGMMIAGGIGAYYRMELYKQGEDGQVIMQMDHAQYRADFYLNGRDENKLHLILWDAVKAMTATQEQVDAAQENREAVHKELLREHHVAATIFFSHQLATGKTPQTLEEAHSDIIYLRNLVFMTPTPVTTDALVSYLMQHTKDPQTQKNQEWVFEDVKKRNIYFPELYDNIIKRLPNAFNWTASERKYVTWLLLQIPADYRTQEIHDLLQDNIPYSELALLYEARMATTGVEFAEAVRHKYDKLKFINMAELYAAFKESKTLTTADFAAIMNQQDVLPVNLTHMVYKDFKELGGDFSEIPYGEYFESFE